jgi:hypothetical protein
MTRTPLLAGGLVLLVLTIADVPPAPRLAPALRLRRTVSVDGACPGVEGAPVRAATSVTYCYTVTNIGSTPARDVVITDAGRSVRVGRLAAGQSRTVAHSVEAPDAGSLAAASGVATEATTLAGAAEASDAETLAQRAATAPSETGETADGRVSDAGALAPIAPLAPGVVFLASTSPSPTLQSP